jgi:hypothetical protein
MRVKLEKWYLDFTSDKETGFYYIMCIAFGRLKIGFSGINHFDSSQSVQSFKFSRIKRRSFHKFSLTRAELQTDSKTSTLSIKHGQTSIKGIWKSLHPPLKRNRKPLYKGKSGWCDWKVWTPLAEVNLEFSKGGVTSRLNGTGYIDFVRFALPFWKIPFHSLYWGRMHSRNSWSVFLSLHTPDEKISVYLDPEINERKVSVDLRRNELGEATSMTWEIESSDYPLLFYGSVKKTLEIQEILSKGSCLKALPKIIRKILSTSGKDEKYEMKAKFRGQKYHGIMEEVTWNG